MPVTDEQEAALHAQLDGRFDEYERLFDALDPVAARTGYSALVSAAFCTAVGDPLPHSTPPPHLIDNRGGGLFGLNAHR